MESQGKIEYEHQEGYRPIPLKKKRTRKKNLRAIRMLIGTRPPEGKHISFSIKYPGLFKNMKIG